MANRFQRAQDATAASLELHGHDAWRDSNGVEEAWSRPMGLSEVARGARLESPAAWLLETIQAEIIPRLMLAHREPALQELVTAETTLVPGPEHVAVLAQLVLGSDPQEAAAYVENMHHQGASVEMIYLELLAPTARRLGDLWNSDDCDFTEVTTGLWRMQRVMYELSEEFLQRPRDAGPGHRVLLAPAPGSQHTFGLHMVAEFFRRAGWQVQDSATVSASELQASVRESWFDAIGLSVGSEVHVEGLSSVILDLRKASINPALVILVGGPLLIEHPELLLVLGADATAKDAPHAVAQAEELVASRTVPSCG